MNDVFYELSITFISSHTLTSSSQYKNVLIELSTLPNNFYNKNKHLVLEFKSLELHGRWAAEDIPFYGCVSIKNIACKCL